MLEWFLFASGSRVLTRFHRAQLYHQFVVCVEKRRRNDLALVTVAPAQIAGAAEFADDQSAKPKVGDSGGTGSSSNLFGGLIVGEQKNILGFFLLGLFDNTDDGGQVTNEWDRGENSGEAPAGVHFGKRQRRCQRVLRFDRLTFLQCAVFAGDAAIL